MSDKKLEEGIEWLKRDTTMPAELRENAITRLRAVIDMGYAPSRVMRYETDGGPIELRFPARITEADLTDFKSVMEIWFGMMLRTAKAADLPKPQEG
jgi:hypothetical protein